MEITITHDEGHAHVAAIRVLAYRTRRPPTIEEVATELGSTSEITNHRLRALAAKGIVTLVENPFETHVSVRDYLALEKLPVEDTGPGLAEAVQDFQRRQTQKADERMRIFEEADEAREKREKHDRMAGDLKDFRPGKAKKAPWEK
jgi:hypothetical protein